LLVLQQDAEIDSQQKMHRIRIKHLGSDRDHNRYYTFTDMYARLWVQIPAGSRLYAPLIRPEEREAFHYDRQRLERVACREMVPPIGKPKDDEPEPNRSPSKMAVVITPENSDDEEDAMDVPNTPTTPSKPAVECTCECCTRPVPEYPIWAYYQTKEEV
jgi:hypothetical protein